MDTVLLMSHTVDRDFDRFYGKQSVIRGFTHVASIVPPREHTTEKCTILHDDRRGRFFHLPDKLQTDKNQAIVIEVLGILRATRTRLDAATMHRANQYAYARRYETIVLDTLARRSR